jgi:hypothetical protein
MERTKLSEKSKWRNSGRGTLYLGNGKVIRPGEVFLAHDYEISKAFRDTVKLVEDLAVAESKVVRTKKPALDDTAEKMKKSKFTMKSRGGGWFHVIGPDGEIVGGRALQKEAAEKLIKSMED